MDVRICEIHVEMYSVIIKRKNHLGELGVRRRIMLMHPEEA
jgi:hypothetical protein